MPANTPLHTRMMTIRVTWEQESSVVVEGRILDLRKRGLVPFAGRLQGPGVVHDMGIRLCASYPDLEVREIEPGMAAFPFGHSPATNGEACSDVLPNVQSLRGRSLRDGYGKAVTETIGGPLGCFHIFTLMRLLGPTVEWGLAGRSGDDPPGKGGDPIFARSVIIDGMQIEGLRLRLRGMLFDLHYQPGVQSLELERGLRASYEAAADVEIQIDVEAAAMAIGACSAKVRRGGPGPQALESWEAVPRAQKLSGLKIEKGFAAAVEDRFAGSGGYRPLVHLLFAMAPAIMQCMPSLAEELAPRPRRAEAPRAAADSCHMWRTGGPLITMPPFRPPSEQ